jgi:hypothetical protein
MPKAWIGSMALKQATRCNVHLNRRPSGSSRRSTITALQSCDHAIACHASQPLLLHVPDNAHCFQAHEIKPNKWLEIMRMLAFRAHRRHTKHAIFACQKAWTHGWRALHAHTSDMCTFTHRPIGNITHARTCPSILARKRSAIAASIKIDCRGLFEKHTQRHLHTCVYVHVHM